MAGIRMARLRPIFSAVADVDYGPTTTRPIRYPIADFKTMLGRFINEYLPNAGTWDGPVLAGLSLYADSAYTGTVHYTATAKAADPYDEYRMGGGKVITKATGNTFNIADFFDALSSPPACPYIDGMGAPREDADLVEFAEGTMNFGFDFFTPAVEEASWALAAHVWLPFSIFMASGHAYSYTCNPSGVTGNTSGGPAINNNFLGIDYSGGGGGFAPAPTGSIPLGDGTTEAFFWTPTGDRFLIDSLNTNNF